MHCEARIRSLDGCRQPVMPLKKRANYFKLFSHGFRGEIRKWEEATPHSHNSIVLKIIQKRYAWVSYFCICWERVAFWSSGEMQAHLGRSRISVQKTCFLVRRGG